MLTNSTLHHFILCHFRDFGFAPALAAIAEHFGVDREEAARAMHALQEYHGVVLHPHAPEVWVAHPFSAAPTNFTVRQGGRSWWGNCGWCSLGVAALLGGDQVTIETSLGAEGTPVTLHVDGHRVRESGQFVHFPIAMTRAWDNVIYTCSVMLVFDSEAAVDDWCQRHAIARGSVQPVQRIYDLARTWYGRHFDADWRKWTIEEAREIFTRCGLTDPVWQLPAAEGRF